MRRLSIFLLSALGLCQAQAGNLVDAMRFLAGKDYGKALAAFRSSAAEGNAVAERQLAFMYYRGTGVAQSDAEAIAWFERAASHGDLQSQVNLGQMYENGLSVAQSDARSAHWYRLAAEQGDRTSQLRFGEICYMGTGMPQDRAEAAKWWLLATRLGDAKALQMRAMIESALNKIPHDIRDEGRRRADLWLVAHAERQ